MAQPGYHVKRLAGLLQLDLTTAKAATQAPSGKNRQATVFVFNPHGNHPYLAHSIGEMFEDLVNIQSAGAALQNMLLAA